jgi:hypothetical protein
VDDGTGSSLGGLRSDCGNWILRQTVNKAYLKGKSRECSRKCLLWHHVFACRFAHIQLSDCSDRQQSVTTSQLRPLAAWPSRPAPPLVFTGLRLSLQRAPRAILYPAWRILRPPLPRFLPRRQPYCVATGAAVESAKGVIESGLAAAESVKGKHSKVRCVSRESQTE